ncbi:uncharacterized protein At1g32220, chloroplastic isoform X2 [Nicotiana sylvestris]|uniref:uncharacterized protein At1g32220, chloroplastic isoform X2 n=1 Tax=Nicotiana sylvestris TaxID=4096 RepID=UPI00388CEBAA
MSRLIQARFSLSRFSSVASSRNVRFLSLESNKTDEPFKVEKATESNKRDDSFKVEEAETVNMPPPPTEKLLVLGGNGFVGSHVCKEALDRGLTVASLSRTGRSSIQDSWANSIIWHQGNLLSTDSWKDALKGVTSVISCVGGFGSNSYMYKINGTANINAIRAASEEGVKRFVYISAADFGVANYVLQGYYEGKRAAETELLTRYPYGVFFRNNSEAWIYLWDPSCREHEIAPRCSWFSSRDDFATCKTIESNTPCRATVYSSCERHCSS